MKSSSTLVLAAFVANYNGYHGSNIVVLVIRVQIMVINPHETMVNNNVVQVMDNNKVRIMDSPLVVVIRAAPTLTGDVGSQTLCSSLPNLPRIALCGHVSPIC